MRCVFALAAALLSACAPLLNGTISDGCRRQYDACLNNCPQGHMAGPQFEVASCTAQCNAQARGCKDR
jgi:hypothetical protein